MLRRAAKARGEESGAVFQRCRKVMGVKNTACTHEYLAAALYFETRSSGLTLERYNHITDLGN